MSDVDNGGSSNFRYTPSFEACLIFSMVFHLTVFLGYELYSLPRRFDSKVSQKESYAVSVVYMDTGYTPDAVLGQVTQSTNPEGTLGVIVENELPEGTGTTGLGIGGDPDPDEGDTQQTIDDLDRQIKEEFDEISATCDRIAKADKDFTNEFTKKTEEISDICDSILVDLRSMRVAIEVLKYGRDINDAFTHTYSPGDRNEISYKDFFEAYANFYLLFYGKPNHIWSTLERNLALVEIITFDVDFESDGSFKTSNLVPLPGFVDEDGKALEFYSKAIKEMPKPFVPPEKAGLQSPYHASYVILNPATRKDD